MASFCGGAVGVLSTLLVVEVNNKDRQAAQRCVYCEVSLVAIRYPNSAVTLACQLLLCPDTRRLLRASKEEGSLQSLDTSLTICATGTV